MSEIDQLQKHIDDKFSDLKEVMSRIGTVTDDNAKDITGLTKTCEFLEKSIEAQKTDYKEKTDTHNKSNEEDLNRLYEGVSKRVKISTLFWVVGIAVTLMGILSPIIAHYVKG